MIFLELTDSCSNGPQIKGVLLGKWGKVWGAEVLFFSGLRKKRNGPACQTQVVPWVYSIPSASL